MQLNSPLIDALRLVLAHGVEQKVFRTGVDAVQLYISIAALGFFYLSNRWTLSTIFRRDLLSDAELTSWREHITNMVLASLKP